MQPPLWDALSIHISVMMHLCLKSITRTIFAEWCLMKSPCYYCRWQGRQLLLLLLHSSVKNKLSLGAYCKRDKELILECVWTMHLTEQLKNISKALKVTTLSFPRDCPLILWANCSSLAGILKNICMCNWKIGVSFKASATNPGKQGISNIIGGFLGQTKVHVIHEVFEWPFFHKKHAHSLKLSWIESIKQI